MVFWKKNNVIIQNFCQNTVGFIPMAETYKVSIYINIYIWPPSNGSMEVGKIILAGNLILF